MSEKDFDWSDDLDFESLAEEKELTADYGEPADSFADFEDLADYADEPEFDEPAAAPATDDVPADSGAAAAEVEESAPAGQAAPAGGSAARPEKVVPPAGLGFLVAACTLVGAVGVGGAVLVALGQNPLALWNPAGLLAFDRILDFQTYPLNLLYLVAVGVVLLTVMGAALASRLAGRANARVNRSENLLSRVTSLRLDNELPWTSEEFKADPDTSAFVTDILGAWRLQQARQVRSVGLEGELRRLEKALREDSRDDMADRYDHPLVGTLADAMVGWYDDLHAARQLARETKEKDEADSVAVLNLIEDARTWNHAHGQRVEVQGQTLQRWSSKFADLAARYEAESGDSQVVAALQGLQKDLARSLEKGDPESGLASLDDLVDRGSKLAFQIAMEVARLGPRGERLLPMSQSLEELTTQFRQAVAQATSGNENPVGPEAVLNRLEQISVQLVKDGSAGAGSLVRTLQDMGPAADKLAANLGEIAGSFGQQDTRLNSLGTAFAELSGQPFDPDQVREGEPVHPPEGGLNIAQSDPFGRKEQPVEDSAEVDPFGDSLQLPGEQAMQADPDIITRPMPGIEDTLTVESFAADTEAANDPDLETSVEFDGGGDFEHEVAPDPFGRQETPLSREEEKVYDLREFGAVRIDEQEPTAETGAEEDRIYDLSEFGAVALN